MAILSSSDLLDTHTLTLLCNEEQDLDQPEDEQDSSHLGHLHLDLSWQHQQLVSLLTKEQEQQYGYGKTSPCVFAARKEAVDWILKVKTYHGFTPLTPILAINYVDRFLSSTLHFQKDQPWMIQLLAVTCLSLAAKIEETQVPLLLDLQVDDTKFLFEAKTIQKMELLVMSTLKWRMNPVTPISFLDHTVRRLRLTHHLHWDFFNKCQTLILRLISDSRFVCYKPSVLATASMLRVVDEIDPPNCVDYKSQLLDLLKTTKDDVNECFELIMKLACDGHSKRKHDADETAMYPVSPAGVIDFACDESSNDSWEFINTYNVREPFFKKTRTVQQLGCGFGSLNYKP